MAPYTALANSLAILALAACSLAAIDNPAHIGVIMTGSGYPSTCTTATTTVTEQATVTITVTPGGGVYSTGDGIATSLTDGVLGPGTGPYTTETISTTYAVTSTVRGVISSECVTITVTSSWSNETYTSAFITSPTTTTGVSLTDPIGINPTSTGIPVISDASSKMLSGVAMLVALIVGILAFFA